MTDITQLEKLYTAIQNGLPLTKICKEYGGVNIYIPKTIPNFKAEIKKEFNGCNHAVLAHKYNVSMTTVYDVLRSYKTQATLF